MTHTTARVQVIDYLDYVYAQLRERVADPHFLDANDAHLHELLADMQAQIELLRRLNEAAVAEPAKPG